MPPRVVDEQSLALAVEQALAILRRNVEKYPDGWLADGARARIAVGGRDDPAAAAAMRAAVKAAPPVMGPALADPRASARKRRRHQRVRSNGTSEKNGVK